jgi:hypothetical protein
MNSKTAIKLMLVAISAILAFHFAILLKFIPYEVTWGGRLKSDSEMYIFENISIVINLFLLFVLSIKGNYIKQLISLKFVNGILWGFLFLFALNTIGNIFAETTFEKFFTFVTLAFSVLIWVILKRKVK